MKSLHWIFEFHREMQIFSNKADLLGDFKTVRITQIMKCQNQIRNYEIGHHVEHDCQTLMRISVLFHD